MVYADYAFYTGVYFGNIISEADFPRVASRASNFLDYYTRGKAKNSSDLEAVKLACCALAEQYQVIERAQVNLSSSDGEKQSETVGSYSVSYRSGAEITANAQVQLANLAKQYLSGTGLLYRGGCNNVCSSCCDCL